MDKEKLTDTITKGKVAIKKIAQKVIYRMIYNREGLFNDYSIIS